MRRASAVFVGFTVAGSVLVFILTVAGVSIPVPLRVIALGATGVSLALCMTAVAYRGPL